MRLFIALLLASSPAAAVDAAQSGAQDTTTYGIVDYQANMSGAVVYMTRRTSFLGETYTRYKTICDGSFMTLYLGSGGSYGEAVRQSAVKGNAALLIGGTGDDASRQACALIGPSRPKRDSNNQ